MFRWTFRDVFWVLALLGVAAGWWFNRRAILLEHDEQLRLLARWAVSHEVARGIALAKLQADAKVLEEKYEAWATRERQARAYLGVVDEELDDPFAKFRVTTPKRSQYKRIDNP